MESDKSRRQLKLEDLVRQGVERMRQRREAERQIESLVEESPQTAAAGVIEFTRERRETLRREMWERFGFSAVRETGKLRCAFDEPKRSPRTPEQKALWLDALVALAGLDVAQGAMFHAAVYFPQPDQPYAICHAFSDVMRETPSAYNAFAHSDLFDEPVRSYAAAMATAWVRTHIKAWPGSPMEKVLRSEEWAAELAKATAEAWTRFAQLDPESNSPIKRPTRFRDTLPRQKDGRRQKASQEPDLINLADRILSGRDSEKKTEPPEIEYAQFSESEREAVLERGRKAGCTPRELQVLELCAENPQITRRQIAGRLNISWENAKKLRKSINKKLGAA